MMPSLGASNILQEVTASGDRSANISGVSQKVEVKTPQLVYFGLELLSPGQAHDPFSRLVAGAQAAAPLLEPGKTYTIRMWTSPNGRAGQKGIYVQSTLDLFLWNRNTPGIQIANPRCRLPADDAFTFSHDFEISVTAEVARGEMEFVLLYSEAGASAHSEPAACLRADLAGQRTSVEPTLLQSCQIVLDAETGDEVAFVHLEAARDDGLRITGWNACLPMLSIHNLVLPDVDLAGFDASPGAAQALRFEINRFSATDSTGLRSWLLQLLNKFGPELCVIFVNHTRREFLWELLELESRVYLGAFARVARWLPTRFFSHRQFLHPRPESLEGSGFAFLDQPANPPLPPSAAANLRRCKRFTELLDQLPRRSSRAALVYLETPGIFTYESPAYSAAVASWRSSSMRRVELKFANLPSRPAQYLVVFINASHSARLVYSGPEPEGFPQLWLSHLASGMIGVLGPIDAAHARAFASDFFQILQDPASRLPLAEILRRLRLAAARRLAADPSPANELSFIDTFLYVYLGNPMTSIRLSSSGG